MVLTESEKIRRKFETRMCAENKFLCKSCNKTHDMHRVCMAPPSHVHLYMLSLDQLPDNPLHDPASVNI